MRALRVGTGYFINADSIEVIQPWPSRVAAKQRTQAIEARCYYDATNGKRILSLITLRSGWVVGSPFHPVALIQRPVIQAPTKRSTHRGDAEEVEPEQAQIEVVNAAYDGAHDDEGGDDTSSAPEAPQSPVQRRSALSRLIGRRSK
ncbi:MAG: DUF370 domain-containing protein [Thermoleophilaceae bacterium]|nr:DUF370 domain-containing protein [Thermoleophilaceae bacterium]